MGHGDLREAQEFALKWLLNKECPQQALLNASNLVSYAQRRGVATRTAELEVLEELGLFAPVLRCEAPILKREVLERNDDGLRLGPVLEDEEAERVTDLHEQPAPFWFSADALHWIRDNGRIRWPVSEGFASWSDFRHESGMPGLWSYYHPYQILHLDRLLRSMTHSVRLTSTGVVPQNILDYWRDVTDQSVAAARTSLPPALRELGVLMALEDLYLPSVRSEAAAYGMLSDRRLWSEWRQEIEPKELIDELTVDVKYLEDLRRGLARAAHHRDPNVHFYMLFRHMQYRQRDKLRDTARLVWDYYEAAELIGLFLADVTDEPQPHLDDLVVGADFKKGLYGVPADEVDYRKGNILRPMLRRLGVDPRPRVLWVVEGESELAFLEAYERHVDWTFQEDGVKLVPLRGLNRPRDSAIFEYIRQVKEWQAGLLVTVDRDAGVEDLARALQAQDLCDREYSVEDLDGDHYVRGLFVWPTNFEDSNFSMEIIFEAWLNTVSDAKIADPLLPRPDELRARFNQFRQDEPDRASLRTLEAFARKEKLHYTKPEVAGAVPRVLSERGENRPPSLPIEKLILGHVLALAARLKTGLYEWESEPENDAR